MDEQNRRPDPQPESWLDTLPERPDSGPGQVPVPAEPPPSREIPEGQAPLPPVPTLGGWDDAGGTDFQNVPVAVPSYGVPAPYTVPPASPYGTVPGTPYGVPPAYPAAPPAGFPPYNQPSGGYPPSGMGYPPAPAGTPMGIPSEWGGAASVGFFGDPSPVPQEPEEKADPSRLRILVAGRPLTLMEYLEILRLSSGHGTTLLVALVLLVLLFEWMAIGDAALGGNDALMSATFLLVMVSSLLLLLGVVWSRLRTDRKRRLAYSTMMADPAAVQGRKLEFYDDRIESVSARGTSVIPFADVTAYIETMRVIALVSGDRCIYIRGQDLTAYDAGLIRSFLRTRVPAKLVRIKAPLIPCLCDPLPIPVFSNRDEVLARACIPYTKQAERRTRIQRFLSALPVVLPMLLALATAMAQYVVLTNWFLLDVAAFFTGFTAVYLLAGAVLLAFGLRKHADEADDALHLAVTRDGIAFYHKGVAGFAVRACVRPAAAAGGVRLILPHTSYFIPEWAMEQPTQFRSVLGL